MDAKEANNNVYISSMKANWFQTSNRESKIMNRLAKVEKQPL